jgi:excisionase family DNA binding protein
MTKAVVSNDVGSGGERLLTPREAAQRLGVGRSFLYEMMARSELPSLRLGRLRRIRASDLDRFIAARAEEARRS